MYIVTDVVEKSAYSEEMILSMEFNNTRDIMDIFNIREIVMIG